MLWYKEWANSDAHPKIVAAGFWGATVFRALCRVSAEFDLEGRVPPSHGSVAYLAHRLQLDATDATEVQRGIVAAVACRLLARDGDDLLIEGWGDRQSVSCGSGKTSTERSRALRDRRKVDATECNGASLHATDATVEKRRIEERRGEDKRPSVAVAPAAQKPPKKPVDPRHAETVAALVDGWKAKVGTAYHFSGGRDGKAVKQLLGYPEATASEIARRFASYLSDPFNRKQASLAHFVSKWAGLAAGVAQAAPTTRLVSTPEDFEELYPREVNCVFGD